MRGCIVASQGHDVLVGILLQHGADPRRRNAAGDTPRDVARRCQHTSVVQVFGEARPLQELCFFRARAAVAAGKISKDEVAKLPLDLVRGMCG